MQFLLSISTMIDLYRRVLAAGAVASTTRAVIETPLEFAKVEFSAY